MSCSRLLSATPLCLLPIISTSVWRVVVIVSRALRPDECSVTQQGSSSLSPGECSVYTGGTIHRPPLFGGLTYAHAYHICCRCSVSMQSLNGQEAGSTTQRTSNSVDTCAPKSTYTNGRN